MPNFCDLPQKHEDKYLLFYFSRSFIPVKSITANVQQNVSRPSIHVIRHFLGLTLGAFQILSERQILVSRRAQVRVHRMVAP